LSRPSMITRRPKLMYRNILQQLAKRIDNERGDLSFKGSSEDKRVTEKAEEGFMRRRIAF